VVHDVIIVDSQHRITTQQENKLRKFNCLDLAEKHYQTIELTFIAVHS
jgi:hypothetical protein